MILFYTSMTTLPFRKIRILLGHKNTHYKIVNIPIIMLKPDLVALKGELS
jgi:hypothetical protein